MRPFTPHQKQILKLVVLGKLNKQIAYEIGRCELVVSHNRGIVTDRLGTRDRAVWAKYAIEKRLFKKAEVPPFVLELAAQARTSAGRVCGVKHNRAVGHDNDVR